MYRYPNMLARLLLALMLAPISVPVLVVAQETPRRSELSAETLIEAARAALAKGELEDAEFLLKGIKPGEGNADGLDFLYGSIAMAREDWQTAIALFRAMLIRDPTLPRVRLDLALAYFRAGEDSNAAYHFRQVLGDEDLPPVVRARTLAFSRYDPPPQDLVGQCGGRTRPRQQYQRCDELAGGQPVRPAGPTLGGRAANQRRGPERPYLGRIRSTHLTGPEVPHRRQPVYADLRAEQVQ